ncbi:PPR 2 domain containing protein [Asbolus verrucosus]|uniref:PPR 2 domain containing protein n=1 Tax=Asbolus verrucosus TaxID=1661398 RepID=A0A482VYX7_ASBVE|nr:PPR 2 domain containing protein [Asbolus verrucosus]
MFRLGLIRYLVQNTSQVSITQECTKFTKGFHYRTVTTRVKENKHENIITSNLKPASQYSYAVNQQTEQEFLIRLKNDPDVFGDSIEKDIYDEKDLEEEKYFQNQPSPSQKLRIKQYADIIKAFIRKRQIKEAIDVLEVKMLQEDRVKPENYIFNLLVGACGRVGYTKKAFSLYNQMKKRGLKVTSSTYTALFNACSNSPWPEDGLNRALHLRNIMMEKMYEPNETNYNAMIKAFGRCGDLSTAFSLVDEMESKNLQIKDDTINFVLQACIQDKEAGFRHALLVWRKLVDKNINPTFYTYNLMLRCIRDCGIGTVEVMSDTLNKIFKQKVLQLDSRHNKILPSNTNYEQTESAVIEDKLSFNENTRPNLMARIPHLGNIISLAEIKKPEDRLLLVGSCRGFLNNMMENNCTPDIKTFTQLLDCLPGSLLAEKELMRAMKKLNVKPDIDFFNMLIKKRSMRFDYDSAKVIIIYTQVYTKYFPSFLSQNWQSKTMCLTNLPVLTTYTYHCTVPT